ncbi:unnamed protein product [Effrenium voratum]|uniref:Uncharacterized protein n=1 Tax=Effrenium voratum TaxID=2562239 RepID=A0AA36J810_9DINO|nr:unnamed protein product [Effrenium voratum]
MADVTTQINHLDAQKKLLIALPNVCEKKNMTFKQTLELIESVGTFGGDQPELKVLDWRVRCQKELGDIVSELIRDNKEEDLNFETLRDLCGMTLDWRRPVASGSSRRLPGCSRAPASRASFRS